MKLSDQDKIDKIKSEKKISNQSIETIRGLSEEEASKRLNDEGFNELPSQKKRHILLILFHVITEPMLLLLLGAGLVYLFLGEEQDALMLLFFVFMVIGITLYQQRKTERALDALRNLSSPRALVIRDGKQRRIPGREVVREDIIILREGDRIPADSVVLFCSNLLVDESLLTGESLSVRKCEWDSKTLSTQPGGDDLPFVYSGTLVVQGQGVAKVNKIGAQTEMGKIGKSLQGIKQEETHIKKETALLVKYVALGAIFLCLFVIIIYGFTRGNWVEGFLAGLSLSMALIPEEFPVVLLIFLSLGAWRMSKKQVLTRTPAAIETLGSATVLCVDKTGTLTMNKMILKAVFSKGKYLDVEIDGKKHLPEHFHDLFEFGYLASQKDPFDPIEKEIKNMTEKYLSDTEHIHHHWQIIREYTLSKNLLALSNVWESYDKHGYVISAKGSPEAIADLCHLNDEKKKKILQQVQKMAENGLRILGVAKASFKEEILPEKQHDFEFEFVGLLGFVDPVRPTVAKALEECYAAGIRVIMITGDYPGTAQNIAREIGLKNPEKYITGSELNAINKEELQEKIKSVNIFARVIPEQKLAIVDALKANGEIVAMTGDGVNDAPALKSAHIGIAMGERGTDVARESSALVLLNDDFSSIIEAVKMGRRIFDNLKKSISYIFAVHVPIAGMALLPIILRLPLVLLPVHIAFLELIIDPACSTVFEAEPEEKNIMNRPPRKLHDRLFGKKNFLWSFVQGISVFLAVTIVFLWGLYFGNKNEMESRTLAFATLVIANVMLILVNLSWSRKATETIKNNNKALWLVIFGSLLSLVLVLLVPVLRELFHFSTISIEDLLIIVIVGFLSVSWIKFLQLIKG